MSDDLYDDTPEGAPQWQRETAGSEPDTSAWPGSAREASGIDGPLRGRYRALWRQFRAMCQHERRPCALCGEPIDYSLRHGAGGRRTAMAFEVDHRVTVAELVAQGTPQRVLDMSLWQAAHAVCNSRRAAGGSAAVSGSATTSIDELPPEALRTRPDNWKPGDPEWDPELGWPSENWELLDDPTL